MLNSIFSGVGIGIEVGTILSGIGIAGIGSTTGIDPTVRIDSTIRIGSNTGIGYLVELSHFVMKLKHLYIFCIE